MKRRFVVWFAIAAACLVVTAAPASAATVVSQNTTASDFQAGTLNEFAVTGSGTAASAVTGNSTYNPVTDQGDGTTDASLAFIGDQSDDDPLKSEVRFEPKTTGTIDELDVDIGTVFGSDYGYTVDIYIVQEDLDGGFREGTLVKSGWDPAHTGGEQTIALDTGFDVDAGTEYTIEFITDSSDGDGSTDFLSIKTDTSASGSWYNNGAVFDSNYADVTGRYVNDVDTAEYISTPHGVDRASEGFVDLSLSSATATVTWEADTDGDGSFETTAATNSYSSGGNKTVSLASTDADAWRVRVTATSTGTSPTVKVNSDGVRFEPADPAFSNATPPDGGSVSTYSGSVAVNVSDADFGTAQGDTVTVTAVNGSGTQIGSSTISSAGTVSFTYGALAGENTITWTANDSYGTTETYTQTFNTPSELVLKNESDPDQTVTNTGSAKVTFVSSDTVVRRPINNGVVSLDGLPGNQEFVAVVDVDEYRNRRVLIESLFEQQTAYLLPKNATSVEVEFRIDDSTGRFGSSSDTTLRVEKPIEVNGSTEYRTVVADRISATGTLPTTLEEGRRYRLVVSNGEQTRTLGEYTPIAPGVERLPIGRIKLRSDFDDGYVLESRIDDEEGQQPAIRVVYAEEAETNATVTTRVVQLNSTGAVVNVVAANDTVTETRGFARTIPINNTTASYRLDYRIERGDEVYSGQRPVGTVGEIGLPVDQRWVSLFSWVFVFAIGGLVVIMSSRAGALVMALFANAFALVGWIQAPAPVLGLGAAAAVLWAVSGGRYA